MTRVTSLASGPAAELFDAFAALDDPTRLQATCIDIDDEALTYVAVERSARGLDAQMRLEQGNLVYLATGRTTLDLPAQDLIYSIGLIDYFSDAFVVKLLNAIHGLLAPGGQVILGNFHPRNPTRALMDHVLDWKLIHRDEADMDRLFAASAFGGPCARVRVEGGGQPVRLRTEGLRPRRRRRRRRGSWGRPRPGDPGTSPCCPRWCPSSTPLGSASTPSPRGTPATLPSRPGVHNHLGTAHAGAVYSLGESASGGVVLSLFADLLPGVFIALSCPGAPHQGGRRGRRGHGGARGGAGGRPRRL